MECGIKPTDKVLVSGANGFLGKYVVDELRRVLIEPERQIVTLGRSPKNDIEANLAEGSPEIDARFDVVVHLVGTCRNRDAWPLNVKATANLLESLAERPPRAFVYISSIKVYGESEGIDIDENHPCRPDTEAGKTKLEAEHILRSWCDIKGSHLLVLRSVDIVGTGMKGQLREMVNGIWRGTYQHVEGEDGRCSVVHATDVASAIVQLAGMAATFNISDGVSPSHHDLAEAFAFRLSGKRILTVKARRAERLAALGRVLPFTGFTPESLARRRNSLTFSNHALTAALGRELTPVTHYLRTHVYDENSL